MALAELVQNAHCARFRQGGPVRGCFVIRRNSGADRSQNRTHAFNQRQAPCTREIAVRARWTARQTLSVSTLSRSRRVAQVFPA